MIKTGSAIIMLCRQAICWFFALLLVTACADAPPKNPSSSAAISASLITTPLPAGKSAATFKATAGSSLQYLQNSEKLIAAGDRQAAQQEINKVVFADLSFVQRSKYNLLEAEIALSGTDAEHAILMLETARPNLLTNPEQIAYYQVLARAHEQRGNTLPAVNARIHLSGLLLDKGQLQENAASILDQLQTLPLITLNQHAGQFDVLRSWMMLAKILKLRDQPDFEEKEQLQQWLDKFPQHVVNAAFLQAYRVPKVLPPVIKPEAEPVAKAVNIAVLLPESGTYAAAGKAIHEGVQAAYQAAVKQGAQVPSLKFYNSEQGNIVDIYQQAVADGAVQVIGPLIKEQIQLLAGLAEFNVPLLALNHVENLRKANLYQFGLSPIDEAEQLVLKARSDGRQNAIILTANHNQGQRIAAYLQAAWEKSGGTVVSSQRYDPKQHDFSSVLPAFKTEPNSQPQIQALLLAATPETGRELVPQLKNLPQGNFAIYAMPNIFSGHVDPLLDVELGTVSFCDIPGLFDNFKGVLSQSALEKNLTASGDGQIRLRALGQDAFNVLNHLEQLAVSPYAGVTGQLALDGENRITRKLVCAQFKGGTPVASGYIE
jgi:outer membrane PBP1 activator LpoA protein